MNARLLVVNPRDATEPPLVPSLVTEKEGGIVVNGDYWARPIRRGKLEDLTAEDVRRALLLREEEEVYLSPVRPLPSDDLMSEPVLCCSRQWWQEFVKELERNTSLAKAL